MELPELLLIDKPFGITSFDVIRELRRRTGVRKFGHAGTLDPRATGLMLIGAGPGTKQLAVLTKLDKTYVATIRLGEQRSTGDLEGVVVAHRPVTEPIAAAEIEAQLATLVGTATYPVSAYSAIKKDGVPMYKRARAAAAIGEVVADIPHREMTVTAATLLSSEGVLVDGVPMQEVVVEFEVGSGTYIRSLAEALGTRLGYPATLAALRRTQVGAYRVDDAVPLDAFGTAA